MDPQTFRRPFRLLALTLTLPSVLATACLEDTTETENDGRDAAGGAGGEVVPGDAGVGGSAQGGGTGGQGAGGAPTGGSTPTGGSGGQVVGGEEPPVGGTGGEPAGGSGGAPVGGGGGAGGVEPPPLEHFSFFVSSLRGMQVLSGSPAGFGGDLRYGETGPGAGLRGADKICSDLAEHSMPGAGRKEWRAFLSASDDGNGMVVHAIDRIGEGPWYDRLGRLLAASKADVMSERPVGADPAIVNDFPNEDGVPNHRPDPTQPEVDNHDTLTGTNENGQLYDPSATCLDWTANSGNQRVEGYPRVGHSWPRFGGPGGGGPGGGGPGRGDGSAAHWMSSLDESGCAPGVNLIEMGPPMRDSDTVGSGGGYGGIYCFALTP